jgi:hypothetical protein
MMQALKQLVPTKECRLPIIASPLRGGVFIANPRASIRKVMGVYEHELNNWLSKALPEVNMLLDIGANDGYFAFGCAAAFRRANKPGTIHCFEPDPHYCVVLERSAVRYLSPSIHIAITQKFVGSSWTL